MSVSEQEAIDMEIKKLLRKHAISKVNKTCCSTFVSNIFTRPKPDGSHQAILNLKLFNEFVEKAKFKMETLHAMLRMIKKRDFMTKVDLTDAFLSVPVTRGHHRFLMFSWRGQLYQYNCMCFGLSSAPRTFTKLMRVLTTTLRKKRVSIGAYLDDSFVHHQKFQKCESNTLKSVNLFREANAKKLILMPDMQIELLGFVPDSVDMTVTMTDECIEQIVNLCHDLKANPTTMVHHLCKVISKLIATWPAMPLGQTQYRQLECEKLVALRNNRWCYDTTLTLSRLARKQLAWWIQALPHACAPLQ